MDTLGAIKQTDESTGSECASLLRGFSPGGEPELMSHDILGIPLPPANAGMSPL